MPIQVRQSEVIERARRVIDAGGAVFSRRRFAQLQRRSSAGLAAHYGDQGHVLRSLWHAQLARKTATTKPVSIDALLGKGWQVDLGDERRLLLHGEPYLAWRRLTDLRVQDESRSGPVCSYIAFLASLSFEPVPSASYPIPRYELCALTLLLRHTWKFGEFGRDSYFICIME